VGISGCGAGVVAVRCCAKQDKTGLKQRLGVGAVRGSVLGLCQAIKQSKSAVPVQVLS